MRSYRCVFYLDFVARNEQLPVNILRSDGAVYETKTLFVEKEIIDPTTLRLLWPSEKL